LLHQSQGLGQVAFAVVPAGEITSLVKGELFNRQQALPSSISKEKELNYLRVFSKQRKSLIGWIISAGKVIYIMHWKGENIYPNDAIRFGVGFDFRPQLWLWLATLFLLCLRPVIDSSLCQTLLPKEW
jgi:hypothetical protein